MTTPDTLPERRTSADTREDHLNDHAALHGLFNALGGRGLAGNDGGPWSATTAYKRGNIVTKGSRVYVAETASTGSDPATVPSTDWKELSFGLAVDRALTTDSEQTLAATKTFGTDPSLPNNTSHRLRFAATDQNGEPASASIFSRYGYFTFQVPGSPDTYGVGGFEWVDASDNYLMSLDPGFLNVNGAIRAQSRIHLSGEANRTLEFLVSHPTGGSGRLVPGELHLEAVHPTARPADVVQPAIRMTTHYTTATNGVFPERQDIFLRGGDEALGQPTRFDFTAPVYVAGAPAVVVDGTGRIPVRLLPGAEAVNSEPLSTPANYTVPDTTAATIHHLVLTGATTLTFPPLAPGKSFTLVLVQDAAGGRTVTWPASVKWPGGTAPTLTTTANKTDVFSFMAPTADAWLGFESGKNF